MRKLERPEDSAPSAEAEPDIIDVGWYICSSLLLHRIIYPALWTEDFGIGEDFGVVIHRENVRDNDGTLRNEIAVICVIL